MRIGIFGHSTAAYNISSDYKTKCELLAERFPNDQIDWYGAFVCSTERMLSKLQKHRNYDLYFLFHLGWQQVYIPGWGQGDLETADIRKCARDADFIKKRTRKGVVEDFELTRTYFEGFVNLWLPSDRELINRWVGAFTLINLFCKDKNVIHVCRKDVADIRNMIKFGHISEPMTVAQIHHDTHIQKGIKFSHAEMELMFADVMEEEIKKFKLSHNLT
jgi:hypothetical protein